MTSRVQIIKIPDLSDGDPTIRPNHEWQLKKPANLWLERLAEGWMAHRGETKPGVRYVLDRLPSGYDVYEKAREKNPGQVDKRLFGFCKKYFDSPNRFLPHFIHLMENGGSHDDCPCTVCNGTAGKRSSFSDAASSPAPTPQPVLRGVMRGRPRGRSRGRGRGRGRGESFAARPAIPQAPKHVDEEGTEDVYHGLIDKLRKKGSVDVAIEEDMSMDWRAENQLLRKQLANDASQPMWMPRLGEIVLFIRDFGEKESLAWDPIAKHYAIFLRDTRKSLGRPDWQAGIVTQVPQAGIEEAGEYQVNYTGYRVELLPDPNHRDKQLSKQAKYVSFAQIRPFSLWKLFLGNVPDAEGSPTIRHAMTAMSVLSLVDKHQFSGHWPSAEISCRGIYMGSELIVIGDMIRLLPTGGTNDRITDVMKVTSIKLKLLNLDEASSDDNDDGHPYNSVIHVVGKAYTTDGTRAIEPVNMYSEGLHQFAGYAKQWYRRHRPQQSYQVPFNRILGRLHEPEAISEWLARSDESRVSYDLSEGMQAVREARAFSSKHLKRVPEGKQWYWADSRAEALDLQTINGEEVAAHDVMRDPRQWRRQIKVLKGEADERERQALREQSQRALRGYDQGGSMISAALQPGESEELSRSGAESGSRERSRSHNGLVHINLDGTGDEDEAEDGAGFELGDDIALPMDDELLEESDGESVESLHAKRMRF